jgi:Gnt-I system high-affinity gluconate transporter
MSFIIIIACIVALILLITWAKFNPFLAFLVISITAGLLLGIPAENIPGSIQKGMGDILGSLVIIIALGAMLGKLVAESGGAERISKTLMRIFGEKNISWALMVTGFVVGIPLFYNVGFVLFVPLIFSVAYQFKLPAVYIGMPMLAALSVTHGFLPPHPSPTALVAQFNANMGVTLLYGLIIAIPTIIVAGPIFSKTLKGIKAKPLETFKPRDVPDSQLPSAFNSFVTSLLPVILLIIFTLLSFTVDKESALFSWITFFGDASIVMLVSLLIATYTLGTSMGKSIKEVMALYTDAIVDISAVIFIVAGAGALKQIFTDSGIGDEIANALMGLHMHPLLLGWLISATIRVCMGSATIAGLTTAGIIAPLMPQTNADPNLMVLAIGAGSLIASHVNDSGFWLFKQYFNTSIKETLRSWTMMETIVGVFGIIGVMILNYIVN